MLQATDLPSIGNLIIAAGVGAVVLMTRSVLSNQKEQGGEIKKISEAFTKNKEDVTRLEHWAWGPLGDNGANSRIKRIEKDVEELQRPPLTGRRSSDIP